MVRLVLMTAASLLQTSASTIAAILAVMGLIAIIELWIPLHARGPAHRAHVGPNMTLTFIMFGTSVGLNGALLLLLVGLDSAGFGIRHWTGLDSRLVDASAIVLLDLSFYVAHLAMHKVPALWKVHRVHHSDLVVDVTTTIRQHPLEGVIRYAFMATFACVAGVGVGTFIVYRTWSALNGLAEHANIRVPRMLDKALALVTTWPNLHKVHHSRDVRESNTNYGNIFSWFDRAFGTYTPSSRGVTVVCGLDEPGAQRIGDLLAMPFVRPSNAGRR